MLNSNYQKFKTLLEQGDYLSCEDFFTKNNYPIEASYCNILKGDFTKAVELLASSDNTRARWALGLIEYAQLEGKYSPSYFQLRNFLELDLQLLLNAQRADFIENVLRYVDYFSTINLECHKFVGRFLFNNDYDQLALIYLKKAKGTFFQDPELHMLLANYYLKIGDVGAAKKEVAETLIILPNYFPAKKMRGLL